MRVAYVKHLNAFLQWMDFNFLVLRNYNISVRKVPTIEIRLNIISWHFMVLISKEFQLFIFFCPKFL